MLMNEIFWDTYSLQGVCKLSPPVAAFSCCLLVSLSANSSLLLLLRGYLHMTQNKVRLSAVRALLAIVAKL